MKNILIFVALPLMLASNVCGAQSQRLLNNRDMYPGLSPDGKQLVFQSNRTGNNQIFIMSLADGKPRQLGDFPGGAETPVFSPDGKSIAFASNRSGPARTGQVWLMNTDGGGLRQLSHGPWSHAQPAWSHDGKSIVAYQLLETVEDEFGSIVRIKVTD